MKFNIHLAIGKLRCTQISSNVPTASVSDVGRGVCGTCFNLSLNLPRSFNKPISNSFGSLSAGRYLSKSVRTLTYELGACFMFCFTF